MKVKVSEATGPVLDWMVAKALGASDDTLESYVDGLREAGDGDYSTDWSQGGPIIEREGGTLWATNASGWRCKARYDYLKDTEGPTMEGPTLLIAAMRCYVASKLGDEVEVPDELI